ncbi:MAG: hypothetical protein AAFZ15_29140 [Bacteroidota bacterium]
MKTIFPALLIVVSVFSLTVPFLILFFQFRKMDAPVKSLLRNMINSKKYEFIIGNLSYLAILTGAIGLLQKTSWGKPLVLSGLIVLLLFVWIQNLWKIIYFQRLTMENAALYRKTLEDQLSEIVQPLEQDVMKEVIFDDAFYDLAVRKNISKSFKRIMVGSVLLLPGIIYLI